MADTTAQLQCTQQGGPFEIVQVPKPTLLPDEVLIRQRVIALNSIEVKMRDTGLLVEHWPVVFGIEGAGVIESVGSAVQSLKPGDEVGAWEITGSHEDPRAGSYQERIAVPEHCVFKKPKNISIEEAASLPICFTTAVCGIVKTLQIPLPFLEGTEATGSVPSSILILGGSAASGAAMIALLHKAYPTLPILATSSPKNHSKVSGLGAAHVFDYKSPSIVADIKAASPAAKGVDVIIDCVSGGAHQADISDVLDPAGSKTYTVLLTSIPVEVPEGIKRLDISAWTTFEMPGGKQLIPSLTGLVESGTYPVPLPVQVVGHGLEDLPKVMGASATVSGEKAVVTL